VGKYQKHPLRANRVAVLRGLLRSYGRARRTFAQILSAEVKSRLALAKARRYGDAKRDPRTPPSLAHRLAELEVPADVYHSLIAQARKHLHLAHRWSRLRKRALGLERLTSYDNTPLGAKIDQRYSYAQAQRLVERALRPLGKRYLRHWRRGMRPGSGWVDVLPSRGKYPQNYLLGAPGMPHPFLLLNFRGDHQSLLLYAHEGGHAMHSFFSQRHQAGPQGSTERFLDEVASQTNECLVSAYLLRQARTPEARLAYLARAAGQFAGKVFRMAYYAELELAIHQHVERHDGITAKALDTLNLKLLRRYAGHHQGARAVTKEWRNSWAWIPHLYRSFKLFRYATSFVTAHALAERILRKGFGPSYVKRFLSAGSSKEPMVLLRELAVDLRGGGAYTAAFAQLARYLDAIEALLRRRGRRPGR